jgi:LmbE family N-acetylglucosaminyl deacetylase
MPDDARRAVGDRAREAARRAAHRTQLPRVLRDAQLGALRAAGRARHTPSRPDPARLRILGVSQKYVPETQSGAEVTLHTVLRELHARGHDTRALTWGHAEEPIVDEIPVLGSADGISVAGQFAWADVVIATGDARGRALRAAARANRPLAFYVQVGNIPRNLLWGDPDLTIFNSRFVERQYPWMTGGIVVHPPIHASDYLTTPGDAITLVNLVATKGGPLLFALAERMPERTFIGVQGWGLQQIPERVPPNVTVLDPQRDMRAVYAQTRILIMPSAYESYGRVALEAAASGIPTIAHPAPGLREALGDAGVWAHRARIDEWSARIEELDDPICYDAASASARARFDALDTPREIDALEEALGVLATRGTTQPPGARRRRIGAAHRRALAATAVDITRRTSTRRALVLAPHPDDETLACGATILRKIDAGAEVMVVVATDGERGGGTSGQVADGLACLRRAECLEACRRLGVDEEHVRFLGLPDTQLERHEPALEAAISALLPELRPDEVFAPFGIDQHPDHRALARVAGRLRDGPLRDIDVLTYPVWMWNRYAWTARDASRRQQRIDLITRSVAWTLTTRARRVDARSVLTRKRHALDAYASQSTMLDPQFVAQFLEEVELFFPFHDPYHT